VDNNNNNNTMDNPANPSPNITGKHEVLTPERIEELRQQENTHVVDFEDTVVLPMADVSALINEARRAFHRHRREHPRWDDARIQAEVRELHGRMRAFARSHARIFATVLCRDTTPEVFRMLEQGIATQLLVERGELEQDVALASLSSEVLNRFGKGRG